MFHHHTFSINHLYKPCLKFIIYPLISGIASAIPTVALFWHIGNLFWCVNNLSDSQLNSIPAYFTSGFIIVTVILFYSAIILPVITYQRYWKTDSWKTQKILFGGGWVLYVLYAVSKFF